MHFGLFVIQIEISVLEKYIEINFECLFEQILLYDVLVTIGFPWHMISDGKQDWPPYGSHMTASQSTTGVKNMSWRDE